ncbi:MAG: threonine synthase [Nitrososphaeria archaeon]|nr:threonine synthase [Nitrososphaeria archaeon]MDW7985980.1 threonine synthase [Nitrososphaerota archaeon]
MYLKCRDCGKEYPPMIQYICPNCFGALDVVYRDLDKIDLNPEKIASRGRDLWRYIELLPLQDPRNIVSLGAGFTRLIKSIRLSKKFNLKNLYLKEDITNPTHSFKDRAASVAISKALEFKLNAVGCASTGNLAAATAAHAARAGLPCYIFAPVGVEKEKLSHALSYGARIVLVEGTYDEANWIASRFAEEESIGIVNVNIRPYYVEGSKTLAYEICEQLGWRTPDHIIIPMASGALLNAIDKGLNELKTIGLIDGDVKISGVQPEGCSPIITAYRENRDYIKPIRNINTIAVSLAIGNPGDGVYALRTIRRTRGTAVSVTDREIIEAVNDLARLEGLFIEPGGAVTIAGLKKIVEEGLIDRDEEVVCLLTGSGLKTPHIVHEHALEPLIIKPSIDELKKIIGVEKIA